MKLNLSFGSIAAAALILLAAPIVAFIILWIKPLYAIGFVLALVAALYLLYKKDYATDAERVQIPLMHVIIIFVILALWVGFSGNCGFGHSLGDVPYRNVLLNDLIDHSWPVYYEKSGFAMSYYITFWILPALVGKVFGIAGAFVFMWLYQTAICFCSALLIGVAIGATRTSDYYLITLFIVLWSGLNIVGWVVLEVFGKSPGTMSLGSMEGYCDFFGKYQPTTSFLYRNNTDCLAQTYNQISIWLAVPLLYRHRNIHSFILLDLLILPYSPWGAIALVPILMALGISELCSYAKESHGIRQTLVWLVKEVFSPSNVLGALGILVVFGAYFTATGHVSAEQAVASAEETSLWGINTSIFTSKALIAALLVFYFCEFGLFTILMARFHRHDHLFWINTVAMILIPFVWVVSYTRDFCMDGSLPSVYLCMIYMLAYIKSELCGKTICFKSVFIIIVLTCAFASPVLQIASQTKMTLQAKRWYTTPTLPFETLDGVPVEQISNFVCVDPESTFFFGHLSR